MVKAMKKSDAMPDFDADNARKVLLGVGLLGVGLLTAAAVGLVVVRKRELADAHDNDFYAMLGIGA